MEVYWLAQTEAAVPRTDDWLGEREAADLSRLRIPKRRADWRLGRWTAKRAVAAHYGFALSREALAIIEVRPAPSGAPEAFIDGRPAGLALSLSHSHGAGFCSIAAAGAELGCDVEWIEARGEAFLADYFTPEEHALVECCAAAGQARILTLLWSAKESALKALQRGLRSDTRSVVVIPAAPPDECPEWGRLEAREAGGRTFCGWWRETGDLIWTVVAAPAPLPPIALSAPAA